jgi:hypothetical protein
MSKIIEDTEFFKILVQNSGVVWQLFNMWGKVIIDLHAWVVDTLFESSQVWCWLMKIWLLSSIYIVDFWVYCKLVFVFYNKHHNGKYVLRHEGKYFQFLKQISTRSKPPTTQHDSDNSLLHSKYFLAVW